MKYVSILRTNFIFLSLQVVIYGLKVFGLAPFTLRKLVMLSDRTQPFRYSKLGSIYNFLLVIPIAYNSGSHILSTLHSESDGSSVYVEIIKAVYTLQGFLALISTNLILAVWGLRQRRAIALLNVSAEIDRRLSSLSQQPPKKWILVSVMTHLIINAVFLTVISIEIVDYTSFHAFLPTSISCLPGIIIVWFFLEYSAMVNFVALKLETVNHCLEHHQRLEAASIRLLRSMRATLVELSQSIADFFALPILFCISYSYITIFYGIFCSLFDLGVMTASPRDHNSNINWIIMTILGTVYPVISLTFNVTRSEKEAGLTARIVNKILLEGKKGSEIRIELKQFSEELLHKNNNVFTAYGLFTLHSTLLPSILSGATSYFIVLLQLRSLDCEPQQFFNCTATEKR